MFLGFPIAASLVGCINAALADKGINPESSVLVIRPDHLWSFAGGKPAWPKRLTGFGLSERQRLVRNFLARSLPSLGWATYAPSYEEGKIIFFPSKVSLTGQGMGKGEAELPASLPKVFFSPTSGGKLSCFPGLVVQATYMSNGCLTLEDPNGYSRKVREEAPSQIMGEAEARQRLAAFEADPTLSIPDWVDFAHGHYVIDHGQKMSAADKAVYIGRCKTALWK